MKKSFLHSSLNFLFKTFYFLLFISISPASLHAQEKDKAVIKKILEDQTVAWNNGSIEEFMKGYWQSDSLVFVGKNGLKYGYNATLENYKKSYPDTAARGKLYFDLLQVKRLSKQYFYVTGRWQLLRSIGNLEGYFTLLFRKIKNEWVIISDHSR